MTENSPVEENIKHSIVKNGFPGKTVKLPFKPVFENCKKHGTSLGEVLDNLKKQDIIGTIEGDYILFRS